MRRAFSIFSSILATVFKRMMGLYPYGECLSFPDFRIGIMLPVFHLIKIYPFFSYVIVDVE
jgi:hypothetical protein